MLNREDIAFLPGLLTQVVRFNERVFSADVMTCEVMMPVLDFEGDTAKFAKVGDDCVIGVADEFFGFTQKFRLDGC